MKNSVKLSVLLAIATAHAFAFIYAWSYLGSGAMTYIGAATNSYAASVIAAVLTTGMISTAPLALLAGRICGRGFLAASIILFLSAWAAFSLYYLGLSVFVGSRFPTMLAVELVAISIFCFAFYKLGARLRPNNSFKPKPLRGSA